MGLSAGEYADEIAEQRRILPKWLVTNKDGKNPEAHRILRIMNQNRLGNRTFGGKKYTPIHRWNRTEKQLRKEGWSRVEAYAIVDDWSSWRLAAEREPHMSVLATKEVCDRWAKSVRRAGYNARVVSVGSGRFFDEWPGPKNRSGIRSARGHFPISTGAAYHRIRRFIGDRQKKWMVYVGPSKVTPKKRRSPSFRQADDRGEIGGRYFKPSEYDNPRIAVRNIGDA